MSAKLLAEQQTVARVRIVEFSEEFLTDRYVAWLNDPEVVRFSEQRNRSHTIESCRAYMQSFAGTPHHFWAIVTEELGHIGNLNAYVQPVHSVADLGILMGERSAWGKGYATEAWLLACELLFADGIRKITAGTIEPNRGMLRVMQKAGMVADGRRIRQCVWEGQEVDVIHAALFAESFKRDLLA